MEKEQMAEIISTLKEMRNACAACFRVIATFDDGPDLLEQEMNKSKILPGFGIRCQELIDRLEAK